MDEEEYTPSVWSLLMAARRARDEVLDAIRDHPDLCVYCGDYATSRDHLIPRYSSGEIWRGVVPVVPSCVACNSSLCDALVIPVHERAWHVARSLRARHGRLLRQRPWTDDELADLGRGLRNSVRAHEAQRRLLMARLAVLELGGLTYASGMTGAVERAQGSLWGHAERVDR